ncbi:MAG: hypothetical protein K8T25_11430 [Planctomycetia bacterium]|nr:hypothetical protein [Planctomycetia bacterium]
MNVYLATCVTPTGPQCQTVLARDRKSAFVRAVNRAPGRVTHILPIGPATLATFQRNQLHRTLHKADACEFIAATLMHINDERRLMLEHLICQVDECRAYVAKLVKK